MNNTSNYQRLNNIIGWFVFLIAAFTYLSTMEATASFWDCGEYIACAYKLEVGHPPGAPLFVLIGRFFSLFAFGDTSKVGMMINAVSALCSAFTILFLFWSITALARKVVAKGAEFTTGNMYSVFGAGAVGALAYTFSDSFWFSAVEGEVYAMSSFFTAIVFWCILKWEREVDDNPHADRWIILIAYLIGLSIGVHLLNLVAIPAIVFIYYFKKNQKITRNSLILTGFISIVILGSIQAGVIPLIVKLAAKMELIAVNGLGMPFNSGTILYFAILIGAIVWGLRYTAQKVKPILNTIILCFTVILIGYSSFIILVIRSQANPPMDENNPENAVNLLSYLNREQYGTWPIMYGQYYSAPTVDEEDGSPVYVRDDKKGRYEVWDDRKGAIRIYDKDFCTIFPRMWSDQPQHVAGYRRWTNPKNFKHKTVRDPSTGKNVSKEIPTFVENLKFFFKYQIGQMYSRYFLWNFVGRQNDIQGHGNATEGNWMSGLPLLENPNIGDKQTGLPDGADKNKAKNVLYGLPFILGLIGLYFHIKKDKRNAAVIGLLFFFTGVAIVVYLNQKPMEPRERDYAYAASFYAFAFWIGFGVLAIFDFLGKWMNKTTSAVAATAVCLLAVPALMAKEEWDDHDRSDRYIARDFAANYLNSCAPNAILFTNGDNDTFPLWYVQEVEGIRTDVRVICLELLNTDWYIDQMVHKAYESEPVPFSFTKYQYRQGTREAVLFSYYQGKEIKGNINVKDLIEFIKMEDMDHLVQVSKTDWYNFFPTKNMSIPVDSATVVNNGTVPKALANRIVKSIDWSPCVEGTTSDSYLQKNDVMMLDLLAQNNWERPVYFAATAPASSYLNLAPYLQLEGLAYRLVPVKQNELESQQETRVASDIMYENFMTKFKWGNMEKPGVFLDNVFLSSCVLNIRQRSGTLASALVDEGKKDKAIKVLDKCLEVTPFDNCPIDGTLYSVVYGYYQAGAMDKANALAKTLFDNYENNINYIYGLDRDQLADYGSELRQAQGILEQLVSFAGFYKQEAVAKDFQNRYMKVVQDYGLPITNRNRQR